MSNFQPNRAKQGKTGQKLIFICSALSYPRILRDKKGQNPNIFLKCGVVCGVLCSSRGGVPSCPLGAGGAGCRGFRCPAVRVPSLYCFCFPAMPAKCALFRILRGFLAGFGVVVWVCIAGCFAWLVGLLCA